MTDHTPAAQAANPDFVGTELRGIIDVAGDSSTVIVSVERMRLWLSKLRAPVATLQWSEVAEPNEQVRYTHVLAESPLGRFSIEWKSWKPHDSYCVHLDGDYLDTAMNLDDAKAIALKKVADMAHALAGYVASVASAPVADERALPPLPSPALRMMALAGGDKIDEYWVAPQMREYARAALASAPVAGEAQQPYCYVLETRDRDGLLLDVEYNGSDSFSGGRKGGKPLYDHAAPQASEADAAALSTAVDYRRMEDTQFGASEHLAKLAAALGNRDWKWWDSCSFRRLTFADGPDRRDGGALCGRVQPSDGHPDVSMAPGVREFIEAASPKAIAALAAAYMAALPAQPGAQKKGVSDA